MTIDFFFVWRCCLLLRVLLWMEHLRRVERPTKHMCCLWRACASDCCSCSKRSWKREWIPIIVNYCHIWRRTIGWKIWVAKAYSRSNNWQSWGGTRRSANWTMEFIIWGSAVRGIHSSCLISSCCNWRLMLAWRIEESRTMLHSKLKHITFQNKSHQCNQ